MEESAICFHSLLLSSFPFHDPHLGRQLPLSPFLSRAAHAHSPPCSRTKPPTMQSEEESSIGMREVMADSHLRVIFRQFLRQNKAIHLLSFWIEVENFRALIDPVARRQAALDIYEKYLALDSLFPIKIIRTADLMQAVRSPESTSFDEAQHSAQRLLEDELVALFFCSPLYLAYRGPFLPLS